MGDTKKPIPIITEQEAVAPEAYPNPSNATGKPAVLQAAEGDENKGKFAQQFGDLKASDRQSLINAKTPNSNNDASAPSGSGEGCGCSDPDCTCPRGPQDF